MKKLTGAIAAIGLAACVHEKDTREFTDGEQVVVDQKMEAGERGKETVNSLVRSIDRPLFDARGKTVDAETFIALLDDRRAELSLYYEQGRIMAFTADAKELTPTVDAGAAHFEFPDESKEYIAVNANPGMLEFLTYGVLMHEIGHDEAAHPVASLDTDDNGHRDVVDTAVEVSEAAHAQATWENLDLPKELSFIHHFSDAVVQSTEFDVRGWKEFVMDRVAAGEMTTAEALAEYDRRRYEDRDAWIASSIEDYIADHQEVMDFMGWSPQELQVALEQGELFTYVQDYHDEIRDELTEELREFSEAAEVKRARDRARETAYGGKKL